MSRHREGKVSRLLPRGAVQPPDHSDRPVPPCFAATVGQRASDPLRPLAVVGARDTVQVSSVAPVTKLTRVGRPSIHDFPFTFAW